MHLTCFYWLFLLLKSNTRWIKYFLMPTLHKNLLIKFTNWFFRWNTLKFEFKELYYIILLCYHLDKELNFLKTPKFWPVILLFTLEFSLNVFTPKKKENAQFVYNTFTNLSPLPMPVSSINSVKTSYTGLATEMIIISTPMVFLT